MITISQLDDLGDLIEKDFASVARELKELREKIASLENILKRIGVAIDDNTND